MKVFIILYRWFINFPVLTKSWRRNSVIYDPYYQDNLNNASLKRGDNEAYRNTTVSSLCRCADKSEACLAKRVHKPVIRAIHYVKSHDDYQRRSATGARR